jgi:hypothetical protein
VHSAFAVTASVVLCLDMMHHEAGLAQPTSARHKQMSLVRNARARLVQQKMDSLARRGVYLIDILLAQVHCQPSVSASSPIDLNAIVSAFLYREREDEGGTHAQDMLSSTAGPSPRVNLPEDFDQWFSHMFA